MTFSPERADRRFGTGLSPVVPPPPSVDAMLERLRGPDEMAGRFPIVPFAAVTPSFEELRDLRRAREDSERPRPPLSLVAAG